MRPSREIEFLLLLAYSVLPMYGGESAVQIPRVILFHALLAAMIAVRVVTRRYLSLPPVALNVAAGLYLIFFFVDLAATVLIAASSHMLLFVALWQCVHAETRPRTAQRMLVLCLLYVAAMATSTSIFVVPFSAGFFFLLLRQLIFLSHEQSVASVGRVEKVVAKPKSAAAYILPVALAAVVIFPAMPRLNSSVLQGVTAELSQTTTTGISDSIDFSDMRSISPDETAISRIWMPRQMVAFFTPIRLRGEVYDTWEDDRWARRSDDFDLVEGGPDQYRIARASGLAPDARIEQQVRRDGRLFLPDRTYIVSDVPRLLGSPSRDVYRVWSGERGARRLEYRVKLGWETGPLEPVPQPPLVDYPLSPQVVALANEITAGATTTAEKSEAISSYLLSNFQYLQNPADLGRTMSVDEFLLDVRRGHCEYFAAGMVVLLRAVGIPSRIVGGFYGGKLNPLTGYWVMALSDAHAWVEVWDAGRWVTYDPTPPGLRPGTAAEGLFRAYASAIADSLTYFWDRYVLSFGGQDQVELVLQLFRSMGRAIAALGSFVQSVRSDPTPLLLVMLLIAGALAYRIVRVPGKATLGQQFSEITARAGIRAPAGATTRELLAKFGALHPELMPEASEIVAAGERELFGSERLSGAERRRVQRLLAELRSAT